MAKFSLSLRNEAAAAQENIPFYAFITPLTEPGQNMQPAHLQGRVVPLRVPARTTPSNGVSLTAFGAGLTVPGLIGAQSKGRFLGRNQELRKVRP